MIAKSIWQGKAIKDTQPQGMRGSSSKEGRKIQNPRHAETVLASNTVRDRWGRISPIKQP